MNLRGSAQRLRTGFGKPDVTNLAFFYQLSQCSNCLFNGRVGIDPVLIIQIDSLDLEAAQAALTRGTNIIRLTIYRAGGGICGDSDDPKFRGEDNLLPAPTNRFPDQLFIGVCAVYVGGIEKVDSEFQGTMDSRDRFVII